MHNQQTKLEGNNFAKADIIDRLKRLNFDYCDLINTAKTGVLLYNQVAPLLIEPVLVDSTMQVIKNEASQGLLLCGSKLSCS